MTMKVLFNGSVLVAPGGATKVDASAMANAGLSGVGVVGLVGYGDAGDDTSAHVFTDADAGREYFRGGPLADAMSWVFNPANDIRIPGGAQRVVCIMANTNEAATATLNGDGLGSGTATSTVAGPWTIPNNTAFTVKIDGGGNQTFTFTGSAATKVGSGATYTAPTNKGFKLKVNNGVEQTFTDSAGTCTNATNLALAINNQISGVAATVNGTQVDLVTDRKGSTAKIEITSDVSGGLAAFGHSLGVVNGAGNTPDLSSVTAADARAVISPTGCSVTGDPLVITSSTTGGSSSVEIVATTGATLFGFTTGVYSGNTPAASVKLTARDKGAHTNNISYKVTTSGSGRILTLGYSDGMRSKTETSPVLGGTSEFSITYSGDATTALLNITSTGLTVTLTGQTDGSVNLNLPFATYPTVKALTDAINASSKYSATVASRDAYSFLGSNLDRVSNANAKLGYAAYAMAFRFVDWVNKNSSLVSATREATGAVGPSDVATTNMTGGVTQATGSSDKWTASLAALGDFRVNQVVPLISQNDASANMDTVLAATDAHVAYYSGTSGKSERQAFVGYQGTKSAILAATRVTNSLHTCIFGQQPTLVDADGVLGVQPAWALAVLAAGMRAGAELGEPLTWKYLRCFGLTQDSSWTTRADKDEMILGGVFLAESVPNKGYRWVKGITSFTREDNDAYTEESVVQGWKNVAYELRTHIEDLFTGRKMNLANVSALKAAADAKLSQLRDAGQIVDSVLADGTTLKAYRNLKVTSVGDTVSLKVECSPVPGINFTLNTIFVVPAQINL